VKVLLVSADPKVREAMGLTVRSLRRTVDDSIEFLEAADGLTGMAMAWRHLPEVVIADEITSRAGAFALAKDLTGAAQPFEGRIVILLDRPQDAWLASWSGAHAWFVKPVDPFAMANTVAGLVAPIREEAV
jgi:DNA-binding NarL/FixJ family response regulator